MPVDDPGWGDYTPLPGEPPPGQPPTQPQPPAQPEERAPVPRTPGGGSGNNTPVRIALGALVLLALAADAPTTAEYVAEADRICRRFTPDINEASQDNDIRRLVRLYKAMVGRLSLQVLPPGEDGDVIQGMLDDFFQAAEALPHDYELALSFASAAQTTAFQMGFEDCSEA